MLPVIAGMSLVAYASRKQEDVPATSTTGFSSSESEIPMPPTTKNPLIETIKAVVANQRATQKELMHAASLAEASNLPQLAAALRTRAEVGFESPPTVIESPWKDTASAPWTRFCRVMSEGNAPDKVNPKGFYGLFQISVRRLCDLGVMKAPKSRNIRLANGKVVRIWEGNWSTPKDRFLSDPKLQYQLFARSMDLYRSIIAEKYKQVLGLTVIENQPATLSGLLALSHTAGSEGMHKWLMQSDIRKKFTWVTDAYRRANGIF